MIGIRGGKVRRSEGNEDGSDEQTWSAAFWYQCAACASSLSTPSPLRNASPRLCCAPGERKEETEQQQKKNKKKMNEKEVRRMGRKLVPTKRRSSENKNKQTNSKVRKQKVTCVSLFCGHLVPLDWLQRIRSNACPCRDDNAHLVLRIDVTLHRCLFQPVRAVDVVLVNPIAFEELQGAVVLDLRVFLDGRQVGNVRAWGEYWVAGAGGNGELAAWGVNLLREAATSRFGLGGLEDFFFLLGLGALVRAVEFVLAELRVLHRHVVLAKRWGAGIGRLVVLDVGEERTELLELHLFWVFFPLFLSLSVSCFCARMSRPLSFFLVLFKGSLGFPSFVTYACVRACVSPKGKMVSEGCFWKNGSCFQLRAPERRACSGDRTSENKERKKKCRKLQHNFTSLISCFPSECNLQLGNEKDAFQCSSNITKTLRCGFPATWNSLFVCHPQPQPFFFSLDLNSPNSHSRLSRHWSTPRRSNETLPMSFTCNHESKEIQLRSLEITAQPCPSFWSGNWKPAVSTWEATNFLP